MTDQNSLKSDFVSLTMGLFHDAGHVASLKPEYSNHSSGQFVLFDNRSDVALSFSQRILLGSFQNVSRLFSANGCVFFSLELLSSREERSRLAHDIHTMIGLIIEEENSVCVFCCDDELMLTFMGCGKGCMLSDWYPIDDYDGRLAERLNILNMAIDEQDYFIDMVYMLARYYYLNGRPHRCTMIPIDFLIATGLDGVDQEEIDRHIKYELETPVREYGDDYVKYSEVQEPRRADSRSEIELLLLDINHKEDASDTDPDAIDDQGSEGEDRSGQEHDEYEYADVDPEIFNDPELMMKWFNKHTE